MGACTSKPVVSVTNTEEGTNRDNGAAQGNKATGGGTGRDRTAGVRDNNAVGASDNSINRPMGNGPVDPIQYAAAAATTGGAAGGGKPPRKNARSKGGGRDAGEGIMGPPPIGYNPVHSKNKPGAGAGIEGGAEESAKGAAAAAAPSSGAKEKGGGRKKKKDDGRKRRTSLDRVKNAAPASSAANSTSAAPHLGVRSALHEQSDDPTWMALFRAARDIIVDPADVHSVIEERLSSTVDLLSPAEITFLQRRIREVVRGVLESAPSGTAGYTAVTTMGNMMGRLTGKDSASTAAAADDVRSRSVQQKENLMDENVFRKVFAGGERWMRDGYGENVPSSAWAEYQWRRKGARSPVQQLASARQAEDGDISDGSVNGGSVHSNKSGSNKRKGKRDDKGQDKHPVSVSAVDPIGSAYYLLLHLSENRWDTAAGIATLSADKSRLDMDVNHLVKKKQDAEQANSTDDSLGAVPVPPPAVLSAEYYGDELPLAPGLPGGVSLMALCFLVAVALRGTREQRLNLLFYLLLPPKALKSLLTSHPAGGIPSWLLEVGSDTVLSFASLSHYLYFGGSFLPFANAQTKAGKHKHSRSGGGGDARLNGSKSFSLPKSSFGRQQHNYTIHPLSVCDAIAVLLSDAAAESDTEEVGAAVAAGAAAAQRAAPDSVHAGAIGRPSPTRHSSGGSGHGFSLRRSDRGDRDGSNRNNSSGAATTTNGSAGAQSDVADYLRHLREGTLLSSFEENPDVKDSIDKFWEASSPVFQRVSVKNKWTLDEFASWSNRALDDTVLDIIMYRLFGNGVLPNASMERDLVRSRWMAWQKSDMQFWSTTGDGDSREGGAMDYLAHSVRKFFHVGGGELAGGQHVVGGTERRNWLTSSSVWGGIGGFDGRGGLGNGIMYCVEKDWWEEWESYTRWGWDTATGAKQVPRSNGIRGSNLTNC